MTYLKKITAKIGVVAIAEADMERSLLRYEKSKIMNKLELI